MADEVIMPALGMAQDTGRILRWLKQPGDSVVRGEPLLEIETDKVTTEVEAPASGVLAAVSAFDGEDVPVGQVIAVVLGPGEAVPAAVGEAAPPAAPVSEQPASHEPATVLDKQFRPPASPRARRLARERGLDIGAVAGSGPGGAVLSGDLDQIEAGPAAIVPATISPGRRLTAARTAHSWATVPHFYLRREIDAAALVRGSGRDSEAGSRFSITDRLVAAAAAALMEHPGVNASWQDGGIVLHPTANIGIAVAVDDGLVVPVVRGAEKLSLEEISHRRRELVALARSRRLRAGDVEGGTFTISNLGMHGVDEFSAIINEPEAAILAVGAVTSALALGGDTVVSRPRLRLTLSCDHRVLSGVAGAEFLGSLARRLGDPATGGIAGSEAADTPRQAG